MISSINYQFLLLQAIGIILVVLGHKGGISLFTDWFPAYSFHMPLFIFISGYFYKTNSDKNIIDFILKKVRNLLIPYFIWNLIYGIIVNILKQNNIIYFGNNINLNTLFVEPWIKGHQFGLNVASWFVPALFIVQLIYVLVRRVFRYINFNNEYIIMIIFMIVGCIGVKKANMGAVIGWNLTIVRTMFLIPFYHMGYIYNQKIEKRDNINNVIYFIGLFVVQFILIKKYDNLSFSAVFCNNFNRENILLPYITSITGIMFWLRICKLLADVLGESKIVKYIGSNTWTIMMHHQFVFFMINLFFASIANIVNLEGFNYERFKTEGWYGYDAGDSRFLIFYVIAGVAIPLIMKIYLERIKHNIKNINTKLK